jgi:hypothetical protein
VTISYLATEQDWVDAIDAPTLADLRTQVEPWRPYVPDALAIVDGMTEESFQDWLAGLEKERRGQWAGMEHSRRFGALLMPASCIKATLIAQTFKTPFGVALIRLTEKAPPTEGQPARAP